MLHHQYIIHIMWARVDRYCIGNRTTIIIINFNNKKHIQIYSEWQLTFTQDICFMNECLFFFNFFTIPDVDVERLYWIEHETGELKSAWFNGSNIKTIISTNATSANWDIAINEDFIFYTSNTKIMKINKALGQNPTVVHTDTLPIYFFLLLKQDGKNMDIKIL